MAAAAAGITIKINMNNKSANVLSRNSNGIGEMVVVGGGWGGGWEGGGVGG